VVKRKDKVSPVHTSPAHTVMGQALTANLYKLWVSAAKNWLNKYSISIEEIQEYGICYSPKLRRLLLPCHRLGKLTMVQARKLFDDDLSKIKYVSYVGSDVSYPRTFLVDKHGTEAPLFIVEDVLSAIKCGRVANALALMTTNITNLDLLCIREELKPSKIIIWLDNDNATVLRAVKIIEAQLQKVIDCPIAICNIVSDPKEMTTQEIESVLYDY